MQVIEIPKFAMHLFHVISKLISLAISEYQTFPSKRSSVSEGKINFACSIVIFSPTKIWSGHLPFLKVFLRHFHLTDKQANTFIYVTHRMLPACIASKRVPLLARLFTSTRSSSASILDVCQNKQQKGCPKVEV